MLGHQDFGDQGLEEHRVKDSLGSVAITCIKNNQEYTLTWYIILTSQLLKLHIKKLSLTEVREHHKATRLIYCVVSQELCFWSAQLQRQVQN